MSESFTNQKRRIATDEECKLSWDGRKNGAAFRCYLCGHRFKPGDGWRWVYSDGTSFVTDEGKKLSCCNPKVCDSCDGPDVLTRWASHCAEFYSAKFWRLR